MTAKNFPKCLKLSLEHEGGYVDHPRDPGGATNKGITIGTLSAWLGRKATKNEVRNISDETVAQIYERNYWNAVRGNDLPDGLDYVAFDGAINSGPSRGAKWLQKGLRVTADGKIGPQTIQAAIGVPDGVKAIQRACAARLSFLQSLRTWGTFGRGWGRRVAGVEAAAVAMYTRSSKTVAEEGAKANAQKVARTRDSAGTTAGGGGTLTLTDIPDQYFYAGFAAIVILAVVLGMKAVQHRRRAEAYREQAKDMIRG